jgi:hypothetical protein
MIINPITIAGLRIQRQAEANLGKRVSPLLFQNDIRSQRGSERFEL